MSEFDYTVKHRPGDKMQHIDALSRNPGPGEPENFVLCIEAKDWIWTAQATDPQIVSKKEVLTRSPTTAEEQEIHQLYQIRQDRVYQKTQHGLLWVLPRGMRHQLMRVAHESTNHGGAEKIMHKLMEAYWFPRCGNTQNDMSSAVCHVCLHNKKEVKWKGY